MSTTPYVHDLARLLTVLEYILPSRHPGGTCGEQHLRWAAPAV